jgi:hypothetical protein
MTMRYGGLHFSKSVTVVRNTLAIGSFGDSRCCIGLEHLEALQTCLGAGYHEQFSLRSIAPLRLCESAWQFD